MERPIRLPRRKQIGIEARRDRINDIGTPVHRGHRDLPRARSVGKLNQYGWPEAAVERCLIDQVDQSNELGELPVFSHGAAPLSAPQYSRARIGTNNGGFLDS